MPEANKRVLLLTRYDRNGGASRVRFLQYAPYLERAGFHIEVAEFFDARYLNGLYAGRRPSFSYLAGRYLRRLAVLLGAGAFDLAWIEKEALPYLPAFVETALLKAVPYVVDYDDAWFHRYDLHASAVVRRALGRKLDRIMAQASLVVAGNDYLAARARAAGAREVATLPSVVDTGRYEVQPFPEAGPFTIGWIGSPSTAVYLTPLARPLAAACAGGRAIVRLIGSGPVDLPGVPVEIVPWEEAAESHELARFHVGIMPIPDGPWERGKCGYKLVQYMAAGRPVVASPVGFNRVLVRPGTNGFLAQTSGEWQRALDTLRAEPGLCQSMGAAGRALAERSYSLHSTAPRLIEHLGGHTR